MSKKSIYSKARLILVEHEIILHPISTVYIEGYRCVDIFRHILVILPYSNNGIPMVSGHQRLTGLLYTQCPAGY